MLKTYGPKRSCSVENKLKSISVLMYPRPYTVLFTYTNGCTVKKEVEACAPGVDVHELSQIVWDGCDLGANPRVVTIVGRTAKAYSLQLILERMGFEVTAIRNGPSDESEVAGPPESPVEQPEPVVAETWMGRSRFL